MITNKASSQVPSNTEELLSCLGIVGFALILPFTFFLVLIGLISTYLLLTEIVKKWFFKRYAYRLEQVLIPRRRIGFYISKTTRLIQNIIAIICLHFENEIPIDSLLTDLERNVIILLIQIKLFILFKKNIKNIKK